MSSTELQEAIRNIGGLETSNGVVGFVDDQINNLVDVIRPLAPGLSRFEFELLLARFRMNQIEALTDLVKAFARQAVEETIDDIEFELPALDALAADDGGRR